MKHEQVDIEALRNALTWLSDEARTSAHTSPHPRVIFNRTSEADAQLRAALDELAALRERGRVLTEALRDASDALDAVQHMDPDIIKPAADRARAALPPEPKT